MRKTIVVGGVALMLKLVVLRTLIALEVLVPVALYASVIIGLGRLHRDQEIIAMRAAGISGLHVLKATFLLAIPVGIAVGILSIYLRPWAYHTSYVLDASAGADLNTDRFQAGRFYGSENSRRVVYLAKRDSASGEMYDLFQFQRQGGQSRIVLARNAQRETPEAGIRPKLNMWDGVMYRLSRDGSRDSVLHFNRLSMYVDDQEQVIGYKRKAASTADLMQSADLRDTAELQWRLSRPLATVLLALIAVPLSRSLPRQGKKEKIFTAVLVFAVYYNLSGLAQTWLEQGVVGSIPGVWWLHMVMLLGLIAMLLPEYRRTHRPPS